MSSLAVRVRWIDTAYPRHHILISQLLPMRRYFFSLQPPRHPALRALLALVGLALLGLFVTFGLVIAAIVLLGFALRRLLAPSRHRISDPQATPRDAHVIDGEYSVVRKSPSTLPPR